MPRMPSHTNGNHTIFFALSSEGMGHATRSLPVIEGLRARGYRVEVFCGGRVARYLRSRIGEVHEIFHLSLHYEDNRLDVWRSFLSGLARLGPCLRDAWRMFLRLLRERPLAVVSDFEFLSAWMGWWTGTPVVTLDNMHLMTHGAVPPPLNARARAEAKSVLRSVRWCQPVARRVLIQSFWRTGLSPTADPARTRFVPCAVRGGVLARRAKLSEAGPVLVYQTSSTNRGLHAALATAAERAGLRFVVYGVDAAGTAHRSIEYRRFSEDMFLDDLAAAPFVIVNGGHSTIVEALALGKPVLCEPIHAHYEQEVNAIGVDALGVGKRVERLSGEAIVSFSWDARRLRARAQELAPRIVDTNATVDAVEEAILQAARRTTPALASQSSGLTG
jgi:uncharacterized protein (TIGR00661 family)